MEANNPVSRKWNGYNQINKQPANSLTPWSRVLFEKLTVTQLVKKVPTFYGIWKFITVFLTTHHLTLSWARWIQSTPSHPISLRPILVTLFLYGL